MRKWIDFFIYNIEIQPEKITKKINPMIISILKAEYLGNYKIQFHFSDGTSRTVDFWSFLNQAKNPMTRKYLDEKLFQDFTIQYGDIIWHEYQLCFPIWDLYKGEILKTNTSEVLQD